MEIYEIFSLCGGVALFLYGMKIMGDGLEQVAGDKLRTWLNALTSKRIYAILVGVGATMLIQSSSAVTVMVVGFVNASLMTLQQAIGIIMGSSIGTTMTGILVSLKLDQIAPLFVLFGVIFVQFLSNRKLKRIGIVVLGFGILFMGLGIMGDALKPLGETEFFQKMIISMESPLLGLLVGVVLTCIIQSSSAFSGILIALAFENLISLDIAVYMVIGSNIGTCITALLASIGTSRNAKMAAIAHLVYKVIGAIVFTIIMQVLPIVDWIKGYTDIVSWQVAVFNTVYNVINCVLLYPFASYIVKFVEKFTPRKNEHEEEEMCLKFIDNISLDAPQLFVPQLRLELERMQTMVRKNIVLGMEALSRRNTDKAEKLYNREKVINFINHEMTNALLRSGSMELSDSDRLVISELYHVVPVLERMGDHAKNIMEYTEVMIDKNITLSQSAVKAVEALYKKVIEVVDEGWKIYINRDLTDSQRTEKLEEEVDETTQKLKNDHIDRLYSGECDPRSSAVYNDMLTDLERIADNAIGIIHTLEGSYINQRSVAGVKNGEIAQNI